MFLLIINSFETAFKESKEEEEKEE